MSPLPVDVSSNDPSMSITATAGRVSIRGTASDTGFLPAYVSFDVGGKKVMLRLTQGLEPEQLLAELKPRLSKKRVAVVGTAADFQLVAR
ncbi:MAG: hypothetical protein JNK82_31205 [Myxococcaceae bacterium]|nr:hypothetical protein [Myxococcaceae bacterium]